MRKLIDKTYKRNHLRVPIEHRKGAEIILDYIKENAHLIIQKHPAEITCISIAFEKINQTIIKAWLEFEINIPAIGVKTIAMDWNYEGKERQMKALMVQPRVEISEENYPKLQEKTAKEVAVIMARNIIKAYFSPKKGGKNAGNKK